MALFRLNCAIARTENTSIRATITADILSLVEDTKSLLIVDHGKWDYTWPIVRRLLLPPHPSVNFCHVLLSRTAKGEEVELTLSTVLLRRIYIILVSTIDALYILILYISRTRSDT